MFHERKYISKFKNFLKRYHLWHVRTTLIVTKKHVINNIMSNKALLGKLDEVFKRLEIIETNLMSMKDEIEDTQIETYFLKFQLK